MAAVRRTVGLKPTRSTQLTTCFVGAVLWDQSRKLPLLKLAANHRTLPAVTWHGCRRCCHQ